MQKDSCVSSKSEHGWFRFSPVLINTIRNLKIGSYPLLYENEAGIAHMLLSAFLSPSEIKEFNLEFEAATLGQRGEIIE